MATINLTNVLASLYFAVSSLDLEKNVKFLFKERENALVISNVTFSIYSHSSGQSTVYWASTAVQKVF